MTKEVKAALIGGICTIIGCTIGIFSVNINVENKIGNITEKYEKLQSENTELKETNNNLQDQITLLTEENQTLRSDQLLSDNKTEPDESLYSNSDNKTVSIFNLETFKGYADWRQAGDSRWYTDTYGNEYLNSYYAEHHNMTDSIPTYLLDYKYSLCEGQIAWSKLSKDYDGSAWVEFYSGDDCIFITDPITADSRVLSFSFSVEGIEKMTIVRKGTKNGYQTSTLCIIYPYLNLIE